MNGSADHPFRDYQLDIGNVFHSATVLKKETLFLSSVSIFFLKMYIFSKFVTFCHNNISAMLKCDKIIYTIYQSA